MDGSIRRSIKELVCISPHGRYVYWHAHPLPHVEFMKCPYYAMGTVKPANDELEFWAALNANHMDVPMR